MSGFNYKLKPCPFCGGKAIFQVISNFSNNVYVGFDYTIKCSKCGCSPFEKLTRAEYFLSQKDGDIIIESSSQIRQQNLVKKWNDRPTEKGGASDA